MSRHVFIATPAYSGKVNVPYAISLAETNLLLRAHGVNVTMRMPTSGSLLVAERNRLLESFWQSGASHMLCIDADLGWPAQAVMAMLDANKEFIAGIYPARNATGFTFRPKLNPDKTIVQDNHLLGMEYIPAGFMLITRSAIEKMRNKFPELYYSPKHEDAKTESTFCLFNTEVWEGEFWGEDYVFCRRAREAGVDIWVDPLIEFDHNGLRGRLTSVLSNKPPEEQTKEGTQNG